MTRPTLITFILLITVAAAPGLHAQMSHAHHSAYADETRTGITSLSADEITQLENGEGMGFARAAELNSYPGPRHVLDAAEELGLSASQREQTQRIFDEMKSEAVRIGGEIIEKERHLSRRFEHRHIDEPQLRGLVTEIGLLRAELRVAHLRAHLEMATLLSAEQIERYDALRGYVTDDEPSPPRQPDRG